MTCGRWLVVRGHCGVFGPACLCYLTSGQSLTSGATRLLGEVNLDAPMEWLRCIGIPYGMSGGIFHSPVKTRPTVPEATVAKIVAHVNRKQWWHVPPADPMAYSKRGKFLASSFSEAEFYGRPLDEPQRVAIKKPLVGDEHAISKALRIPSQREAMSLEAIAPHDERWRNAALAKGFDSIVLMAPKAFAEFKRSGKLPRSLELNILETPTMGH